MLVLREPPFNLDDEAVAWVEDTLASLTVEQKVGQLFCLLERSVDQADLDRLCAVAQPAGFTRRPGAHEDVAALNDYLQGMADVPMLISANFEFGPIGLALDATPFGSPLQVGATADSQHAYRHGVVCGREARALGATWAFGPILDIQLDPANPMALTRAYGSSAETVAMMGEASVRGLQGSGVAACLKHWPGDGVDDRDQHLVTAINDLSVQEWEETFGVAYRRGIEAGALTVMAGHIALPEYSRVLVPGIADEEILPASLAPELTTTLLRERLGFRGLVVTDASNMAGLLVTMPRSELVPRTIAAGCDMFLFAPDYAEDFGYMLAGVRDGVITPERLDEAVTRTLALKAALGLHRPEDVARGRSGLAHHELDLEQHRAWARRCADHAVTLVKAKESGVLPLDPARHRRVLVRSLRGAGARPDAAERVVDLLRAEGFDAIEWEDHFGPRAGLDHTDPITASRLREDFDALLYLADVQPVSNVPTARLAWSGHTGEDVPKYLAEMPTILVSLGSPFHLQDVPRIRTFINAYAHDDATIEAVVAKLIGRSEFVGRSPVDPFCGYWDARL